MRQCFIEPIAEFELAAKLLDAAVDALLAGDRALAAELIARADNPLILEYTMKIVGKISMEVHRQMHLPLCLSKAERNSSRMPSQVIERSIFARDGWRCRFCGIKVISRKSRNMLVKLFPNETHWVSGEFQRHPALYAMASSLDHVVPHSRGGSNETSNFVTACTCCQFGRGQWTIAEVQLDDPRKRPPKITEWDGLARLETFDLGTIKFAS